MGRSVGGPRCGPAVGEDECSHGEDAAQTGFVPRLPGELDPLLHLPARALGSAAADRQIGGIVRGVAHL